MRILILSALMASIPSLAAESDFQFSGQSHLGGWSELSLKNDKYQALNYANMRIDLNVKKNLDNGVRFVTSLRGSSKDSTGKITPYSLGQGQIKQTDDFQLGFRTFATEWDLSRGLSLGFGRYSYAFGNLDQIALFKDERFFSALIPEHQLNGFSLLADGMHFYMGVPTDFNKALTIYGDFKIDLLQERQRTFSVTPMLEVNFWDENRNPWTLGGSVDWSQKWSETLRYKVHGNAGVFGNPGSGSNTYGILVEPTADYDSKFSLGMSLWQAFLSSKDSAGLAILPLPLERMIKGELSVPFAGRFSFDLPVSWMDPIVENPKDQFYLITPGLSVYMNGRSSFSMWGGVRVADQAFGPFVDHNVRGVFGLESHLQF